MSSFIGKSYWQQDIQRREILYALAKSGILFGLITWLFYNSWYVVILYPLYLAGYLSVWNRDCCREKEEAFCVQFRDGMKALASSLRAGYSIENGLRETLKDVELIYGKDARLRKELYYMVRQLDMNVSMEEVLRGLAKRVPQEDVESFVTIFSTAGKYGGDSIGVIQNSVKILCDKMEVRQEIRILMAAKQFEFKVMTVIPFGIILYMRMAFGDFMRVLYGNLLGAAIMSVCLLIYLGAWIYGKKITDIEI